MTAVSTAQTKFQKDIDKLSSGRYNAFIFVNVFGKVNEGRPRDRIANVTAGLSYQRDADIKAVRGHGVAIRL